MHITDTSPRDRPALKKIKTLEADAGNATEPQQGDHTAGLSPKGAGLLPRSVPLLSLLWVPSADIDRPAQRQSAALSEATDGVLAEMQKAVRRQHDASALEFHEAVDGL